MLKDVPRSTQLISDGTKIQIGWNQISLKQKAPKSHSRPSEVASGLGWEWVLEARQLISVLLKAPQQD